MIVPVFCISRLLLFFIVIPTLSNWACKIIYCFVLLLENMWCHVLYSLLGIPCTVSPVMPVASSTVLKFFLDVG